MRRNLLDRLDELLVSGGETTLETPSQLSFPSQAGEPRDEDGTDTLDRQEHRDETDQDGPGTIELRDVAHMVIQWSRATLAGNGDEECPMQWPRIPAKTPRAVADLCYPRNGWTASAWRDRLQQLAQAAENANAERARELQEAILIFRSP